MSSIQETFQPRVETESQSNLFKRIIDMYNNFWNTILEIHSSNDCFNKNTRYFAVERQFSKMYNILNKEYRELFHQTQNSAVGLYNKQHNKIHMLNQLLIGHPDYQFTEVNNYKKTRYHFTVLVDLLKENANLMYAIYGDSLDYLQIHISAIKIMVDYFLPDDVNWQEAYDMINQFFARYDVQLMKDRSQFYKIKTEKKTNAGMRYKTKNAGLEYTIKMLMGQGMKKTQICRELNIPRQTLYDIIKRYNLDKPITL